MIEASRTFVQLKLEREKLHPILSTLAAAGWEPAVFAADQEFMRRAKVPPEIGSIRQPTRRSAGRDSLGDVFFKDGDIYFLRLSNAERIRELADGSFELEAADESRLEVGVITESAAEDKRETFATAVEAAVKENVDGRRARYMKFDWRTAGRGRVVSRLESILQDEDGGTALFAPASLDPASVQGAEVLADPMTRAVLIEINKAGFARENDVLDRWARRTDAETAAAALQALKDADLLVTKHLLVCKANGAPLTEFDDPAAITTVADLTHPGCGRRFGDELLHEGYSVSVLGRELLAKSHWMTVWVTSRLVAVGIPLDGVHWNVTDAGEEVDLVVAFLDELWIIELKDRDFGPGDAYPFNYRRARYTPQRALIISTGRVSDEARRVFDELTKDAREPGGRAALRPIYIEGLAAVPEGLQQQVAAATLAQAIQHLAPLSAATGFDLRKVLATRFGGAMEL